MFWSLDFDDDSDTLLKTATSKQMCGTSATTTLNYKCSPLKEKRWWTMADDEVCDVLFSNNVTLNLT